MRGKDPLLIIDAKFVGERLAARDRGNDAHFISVIDRGFDPV
jgi:hypothetical protein